MNNSDQIKIIFEAVLQKAKAANAKQVLGVHLRLGQISGYKADDVQARWNELCRGTVAENARLFIDFVPAEVQCMACFSKYQPQGGKIICPNCRSVGAKILSGEEFSISKIELG